MRSTILIQIFLILLTSSCLRLPHRDLIILPASDHRHDNKLLRIDGYYYTEREREYYCRYLAGITTGVVADSSSVYLQKYISAMIFYNNGTAYYTGDLQTSGINLNRKEATSSNDHCNLVSEYNTFAAARQTFENQINADFFGTKRPIKDRGIFSLKNDSIKVQIYQNNYPEFILYTVEGFIPNDSTIKLTKESIYYKSKPKVRNLNITYYFKQYGQKPDSSSYILNHKEKFQY